MSGQRAYGIPRDVLDRWYVCGRKRAIPSEVIATLHAETLRGDAVPYPCPYSHHWHVGKRQTGAADKGMNHRRRQAAGRLYAEYQARYGDDFHGPKATS